jgi:hypothetical protein
MKKDFCNDLFEMMVAEIIFCGKIFLLARL